MSRSLSSGRPLRAGPVGSCGLLTDRLCYHWCSRTPSKKTRPMNDRFLKTGIFLAPFHALGENPLLALDRDMDLLVHLDRLNYHEAWIGEHHSGGYEIIACPE